MTPPAAPVRHARVRARRPRWAIVAEQGMELLILLCGISAIVLVLGIFFFVFREALPALTAEHFNVREFLFSIEWYPTSVTRIRYGVLAMIAGTLAVTAFAMLLAVPFGLGAAIYVSEFCSPKLRETLKIVIELLAAIPSVVWGFIGLTVMNNLIITVFDAPVGLNVLNAGLLLALMSVPIIVSIGEDALKAVPDSYREAAEALGATRWQMVWKVVVPHARPGLSAAVLLGIGRAFGETIAVLMASGHRLMAPESIFDSAATITATIAAELGEAAVGSDHYQVLFVLGLLLFLITFTINLLADRIVRGRRRQA